VPQKQCSNKVENQILVSEAATYKIHVLKKWRGKWTSKKKLLTVCSSAN